MHINHQKQNKAKVLINLRKAQSHIAKVVTMVEDDAYCVDVMQQNLAVTGLLKSAHQMLMEDHLNTCFDSAMKSKDNAKKAAMVDEILKVTKLVNK